MRRLKEASVRELRRVIVARRPDLADTAEMLFAGRIPWTRDLANVMRDLVGSELLDRGFDPLTHELSPRGRELESLIDELARVGDVYGHDGGS